MMAAGRPILSPRLRKTTWELIYFLCEAYFLERAVSLTDMYLGTGVSKSTAIRCVKLLQTLKVVDKRTDAADKRRAAIVFAPPFRTILKRFRDECLEEFKDLVALETLAERERAMEAVRLSEERFRHFAALASDGFWEMGPDLRFTWVSTTLPQDGQDKKVLEETMRLAIGKHRWDMAADADDTDKWVAHQADLNARRPFRNFTYRARMMDGTTRMMCLNGDPMFDATGEFIGYRGTVREGAADDRPPPEGPPAEPVNAADKTKILFLAGVSHELRTPLTSIIGFAEIIADEIHGPVGNALYAQYARDIVHCGEVVLVLINDIVDLARHQIAGVLPLEEHLVDPASVIDACRRIMKGKASQGRIDLRIATDPQLPHFLADGRRVTQLLLNLLANAVEFTPDGGTVVVDAGVGADGGIYFRVSDTGPGIDETEVSRVFEPFGQGQSLRQRGLGGYGLGLPMAKTLAELHGGAIHLRSHPGDGTTITVAFPPERTHTDS